MVKWHGWLQSMTDSLSPHQSRPKEWRGKPMTNIDLSDIDSDVLELVKITAREVGAGMRGDKKLIEELSMQNLKLAEKITRRLNPDRDVVWKAVASGLKIQTMNTPLVDQITNAVMDLFKAQSSAAGETT
jgi:hypothetical protein